MLNYYSSDFHYLLQKLFYDFNWIEGSSILSSLRVWKKYGLLPSQYWTYTTQADRELPYSEYIKKLQAVPASEIARLITLCENKIKGYVQVNVNDPMALAKAIDESKSGILCRFEVGNEWWTPSWNESDINPLKPPKEVVGGHAIIMNKYDFTNGYKFTLSNTWSTNWCRQGCADIDWSVYRPTEAWLIVDHFIFAHDLKEGDNLDDVKELQKFLNTHGFPVVSSGPGSAGQETIHFGPLTKAAVIAFQKAHNINPTGFFGPITRGIANSMA